MHVASWACPGAHTCCLWAQAEEADGACTNIGNLFDESVTEAADSARFQDFGAADETLLTGVVPSYSLLCRLHVKSCHEVVLCFDALLHGCAE